VLIAYFAALLPCFSISIATPAAGDFDTEFTGDAVVHAEERVEITGCQGDRGEITHLSLFKQKIAGSVDKALELQIERATDLQDVRAVVELDGHVAAWAW
jgi:hypothetical protein